MQAARNYKLRRRGALDLYCTCVYHALLLCTNTQTNIDARTYHITIHEYACMHACTSVRTPTDTHTKTLYQICFLISSSHCCPVTSHRHMHTYTHTHIYIYIYISTPRNIARIQTRHVFNLFLSKCLFGSSARLSIPIPSAATHGGANNGAHTVTLGHDRQSQDNIFGFAEGV